MKRINVMRRGLALFCTALLLFCFAFADSVPVYAANTTYADMNLTKLVDIVLTKQGVAASESSLRYIVETWKQKRNEEIVDFIADVEIAINDGSISLDTVTSSALDSIGDMSSFTKKLIKHVYGDRKLSEWITLGFIPSDGDLTEVALGLAKGDYENGGGRRRGSTYTVTQDAIQSITNAFEVWWEDNMGYYVYRVPSVDDIPVTMFASMSAREQMKKCVRALENSGYIPILNISNGYDGSNCTGSFQAIDSSSYLLKKDWGWRYSVYMYDSNWEKVGYEDIGFNGRENSYSFQYSDFEYECFEVLQTFDVSFVPYIYYWTDYAGGGAIFSGVVGSHSYNIKVFKTLNALKLYSCGQQEVYITPTYSIGTVNNVTYSGDYYCDNSAIYNHGIVQDSINNIQGDLTDSIVDSVVDDSVTNITNNYYYGDTSGDGSGGGSGDGSSSDKDDDNDGPFDGFLGSLGDLLGNAIGIIDDLLGMILQFIVDAFNVILSMLSSVIELINTFGGETSGLAGALAAFFPFIPEEIFSVMTASIYIICGLAIINYFKKG